MGEEKRTRQKNRKKQTRSLDLLFIHDCTDSQAPYISGSAKGCRDMVEVIRDQGKLKPDTGLRVGLIAFWDHHPDEEFLTDDFGGFTHDIDKVITNIRSLGADGGDDFPEAVTAALAHSLRLEWRDDAAKLAVLITDAPPHGIGEEDDDYPDGDPDHHDPLDLARQMAKRGITLLVIACEPTLSNYHAYAHDFYAALAKITSGEMVPLTDISVLTPLIIGFTLEQLALDELVRRYKERVQKLHENGWTFQKIMDKLWNVLSGKDQKVITPKIDQTYDEPPEFHEIVKKWVKADNIISVRQEIKDMTTVWKRVRSEDIGPRTECPKIYVSITLKNLSDDIITYRYCVDDFYMDSTEEQSGSLRPGEVLREPKKFLAHTQHEFTLWSGPRKIKDVIQTFSGDKDWELSKYFN